MSTGSDYPFLVPDPDFETEPFWTAVRNHEFKLQQCGPCSEFRWPPQQVCPYCQSEDHQWQTLSGKATLYTYIIITQPVFPQWREIAPYNVVQVAPDEAPNVHMVSNVVEVDNADLKIGMPLEIVYDDVTPEDTIFRWKPA